MLFDFALAGMADENEVRAIIGPFLGDIGSAIRGGWEEWMSGVEAETRGKISSFQRGGVVHELMVDRLTTLLSPHDGIEVSSDTFFKVYIDQRVVLRVKKVTQNHLVLLDWAKPNAKDYYWNNRMSDVREGVTRLTIGYILNFDESDVGDVVITQQIGSDLLWSYSVIDEYMTAGSITAPVDPPEEADIVVDESAQGDAAGEGA